MRHARRIAVVLILVVIALTSRASTEVRTLIAAGSLWKFNDSGIAQSGWTGVTFNDGGWGSGFAQLGYGDGDELTTLFYGSDANNKRITYYFRQAFTVSNPAAYTALVVRYIRDDGAVIYLNGVEVVRSNMPAGAITSTTLAPVAIGGADESAWTETPIPASLLTAGTNVVAVEIHQQSATSTDVSLDLELRATEAQAPPPVVTLEWPASGGTTNATALNFQASLTSQAGLANAVLYVGGPPITTAFSGPSQVQDAQITADSPALPIGAAVSINVDGLTPHAHGLLKFPTLIGGLAGQVPAGAIITSATLRLNCTNPGQAMRLYRLTQDWNEDLATWNERAPGMPWGSPGADGAGANAGVAVVGDCTATGLRNVDVTRFVQEWASGSPNYGIVLADSGTDGVDFDSSESATSPILTVVYKGNATPLAVQPVAGPSASVTFPVTLGAGTYYWNVLAIDVNGAMSFASADYQLTVDPGAPNAPALVLPADGATNVPTDTTLQAIVSSPGGGTLTATAKLRKAAAPEFTIIALPDTQHYSEAYPEIFTAQTQWIVNNKVARNIVFVTHEGDVVEHQTVTTEWQRANASMTLLDGVVPYGIGPGNHDLPTTNFNLYFPWTRYAGQPWYGGHYQNLNDHNFELFSGGGMDFVIVHLAFCPPAAAVTWADSVFKTYPNRIGMMTTHGYLDGAAQRTVHSCTSTQYLWDGLAVPNPNLHFMLSGHVHDESRRIDVVNGHPVYQMLADYQDRASGGEGWLRILRFVPADNKVYVQTYSPWLNRYEIDANSEFQLDFPMAGPLAIVGSANVASGGTATIAPSGLLPGTAYEWQMTVTNSAGKSVTGPVWRFTTAAAPPPPPPPTSLVAASFNTGQDGFTYLDDAFKNTRQAKLASGSRLSTGGFTGGALQVLVGGIDNKDVTNMSGGWRRTFSLSASSTVTLAFRYNLNQGANYESDELSQVLATLNGTLLPVSPGHVAQVSGNGDGGSAITTGWQVATIPLGTLTAGTHTLTLGGFNNKKTDSNEQTSVLIDDVSVQTP